MQNELGSVLRSIFVHLIRECQIVSGQMCAGVGWVVRRRRDARFIAYLLPHGELLVDVVRRSESPQMLTTLGRCTFFIYTYLTSGGFQSANFLLARSSAQPICLSSFFLNSLPFFQIHLPMNYYVHPSEWLTGKPCYRRCLLSLLFHNRITTIGNNNDTPL